MVCITFFLVLLTILIRPGSSKAQTDISHFQFRIGFFSGPVSYIGDYNPWILGSPYSFSDDLTATNKRSGKVDFGIWAKTRLKPYLYLRGNAHFGSLTYKWNNENFDYLINSSYSSVGLLLETVAFSGSTLQPYLSSGIKRFNYEVPPPISQTPINQYSVSEFGKSERALMIPVNVGINYQVSHLSNFFIEASLSLSNTDDIDNLSLPSSQSDMLYQNDALLAFRFGVGISLIDLVNLKTPEREIEPSHSYYSPTEKFAGQPRLAISMPTDTLVPQDSIDAAKKRLEATKLTAKDQQKEKEELIEVNDPENRDINISEEVERVKQMQQEMKKKSEAGDIENLEEIKNRIPRIDIRDSDIDISPGDREIVTVDPPQGYYIQVFASEASESAQRVRQTAIREIGYMLENPQKQIIITKRRRYYEVQIGVFDSYENTINVLEEIRKTFGDAFTLMYIKR